MKDKKAILGIDTAKLFVIAIVGLVAIAIVSIIVLNELIDNDIGSNSISGSFTNVSSIISMNFSTNLSLDIWFEDIQDISSCSMTITGASNRTGSTGETIESTNYSVEGCTISPISGAGLNPDFNNTIWNLTGTYTGLRASDAANIVNNTTRGLSEFFEDVDTWFILIGVVIIILIVAVVIVVINRFGSPTMDLGSTDRGGTAFGGSSPGLGGRGL